MSATPTNTANKPVTPENTADMVTDKGADLAARTVESLVPFGSLFNLRERLRNWDTLKKLQSDTRDAIVTHGNDKSSFLGQIFGWIDGMIESVSAFLDKTFGSANTPTNTNNGTSPAGVTPPAGNPQAAQAAAAGAKPTTPVKGGHNASTTTAPGATPGSNNQQAAGAHK